LPFGTESFKIPNIGLLTIEQALGDYAVLLRSIKKSMNASSCPVIAFGGRYL
jgi:dipeptidyl-peptidase-2